MNNRRKSSHCMGAVILVAVTGIAHAQNAPGTHQDNGGINGSLSREDLEKLGGDHAGDANVPQATAAARAKAKSQSEALVNNLQLSCDVNAAELVVEGTRKPASGGKPIETRVYEVACTQGMGYLLETQGTEQPIAISCLNAEETRADDAAKGKTPEFFCKLPANKDVYATVASIIAAGGGAGCAVGNVKLFGHSELTRSEYNEVACKDGKGYLLRTALPGSRAKTLVTSCSEAAKQGIKCRLTDAGPIDLPVTLDTFKGVLAQHGVSCNIGPIRLIGQEDHLKRYVVEYRCADQPGGMVAFLPLEGNTNPYEAMDCRAAAAAHSVTCKFAEQ